MFSPYLHLGFEASTHPPMTQRSSKVQQALSGALLHILQSPNLSPEDAKWIQKFGLGMITEFNLVAIEKEAPGRTIAA